jgi:penicillin-binding protein 1A
VFANGGFGVEPYFIDRIENSDGETVYASTPLMACDDCLTPEEVEALDRRQLEAARANGTGGPGATGAPGAPPPASDAWTVEASEALLTSDAACTLTQTPRLNERHAPRVLSAQNAYMMTSMMQDVVRRGTGARVSRLGRSDLAGKTGTTNDHRDAWFSGFNRSLVATTWIGFDRERPLGRGEAGASVALPGWMAFMGDALDGVPERFAAEPKGLVTVRISPDSGLIASADAPDSITEIFRENNVPARAAVEFGRPLEEDIFDDGGIF